MPKDSTGVGSRVGFEAELGQPLDPDYSEFLLAEEEPPRSELREHLEIPDQVSGDASGSEDSIAAPGEMHAVDFFTEASVLGAFLLMDSQDLSVWMNKTDADFFAAPAHNVIYSTLCGIVEGGDSLSLAIVADSLRSRGLLDSVGGLDGLRGLCLGEEDPSPEKLESKVEILRTAAMRRMCNSLSVTIGDAAKNHQMEPNQVLAEAQREITRVQLDYVTPETVTLHDISDDSLANLERILTADGISGMPTGVRDIDRILNGYQPGCLYVVGARPAMGKALSCDTPIPTPWGWKTMGELKVGDPVYDINGQPTPITIVSEVFLGHTCYEFSFDSAPPIVADEEHIWWVRREGDVELRELTSKELVSGDFDDYRIIPNCSATDDKPNSLRLSPSSLAKFILGLEKDLSEEDLAILHIEGAIERGRIPDRYVKSPDGFRLDLLRILFAESGSVTLTSLEIAKQVSEIVNSLGLKSVVIRSSDATVKEWTVGCEFDHRALFDSDLFDLERLPHEITSIKRVTSQPTKCIGVASPTKSYLAGKGFVPTHNTAFAMNGLVAASVEDKYDSLFFSLEMSRQELYNRAWSSMSMVPYTKFQKARLTKNELESLEAANKKLRDGNFMIKDQREGVTLSYIRAQIEQYRLDHEGKLDIVFIDFLTLMSPESAASNRHLDYSDIVNGLKRMAGAENIAIVLLAQLNRGLEQRQDKRPVASDLRESGAIEEAADVALFLYRDEVYEKPSADQGVLEVIVGKHRHGPLGVAKAGFIGQCVKIVDLAEFRPGDRLRPPPRRAWLEEEPTRNPEPSIATLLASNDGYDGTDLEEPF